MKISEESLRVEIHKMNLDGDVTYKYEGVLVAREGNTLTIEAFFDRDDMPFQGVILKKGDRFVEYYYTDHWYNVFEIHDRDNDEIKGWYCNVCVAAEFEGGVVSYVDLALDLWVSADGVQTVLDEDEFETMELTKELRAGALNGLKELQLLFNGKTPPR